MRSIRIMLIVVCTIITSALFGQTIEKKETFKVYGECGMCKSRIEKALKIDGVSSATWSVENKLLTISYSAAKITNDEIQKKLAAAGHDTENYAAANEVYNKLPGCCHYERKRINSAGNCPQF